MRHILFIFSNFRSFLTFYAVPSNNQQRLYSFELGNGLVYTLVGLFKMLS